MMAAASLSGYIDYLETPRSEAAIEVCSIRAIFAIGKQPCRKTVSLRVAIGVGVAVLVDSPEIANVALRRVLQAI